MRPRFVRWPYEKDLKKFASEKLEAPVRSQEFASLCSDVQIAALDGFGQAPNSSASRRRRSRVNDGFLRSGSRTSRSSAVRRTRRPRGLQAGPRAAFVVARARRTSSESRACVRPMPFYAAAGFDRVRGRQKFGAARDHRRARCDSWHGPMVTRVQHPLVCAQPASRYERCRPWPLTRAFVARSRIVACAYCKPDTTETQKSASRLRVLVLVERLLRSR